MKASKSLVNKIVYLSEANKEALKLLAQKENVSMAKMARTLISRVCQVELDVLDRDRGRKTMNMTRMDLPSRNEIDPVKCHRGDRLPVVVRLTEVTKVMLDILVHVTGYSKTFLINQFIIDEYMKLDAEKISKAGLSTPVEDTAYAREKAFYKNNKKMVRPLIGLDLENFPFGGEKDAKD